jgi:hypothetical protein
MVAAVEHDPAAVADAQRSRAAGEGVRIGEGEAQRRMGPAKILLDVDERGAGNMGGLVFVAAGHDAVGALRIGLQPRGAIEDAEIRIAEAILQIGGADQPALDAFVHSGRSPGRHGSGESSAPSMQGKPVGGQPPAKRHFSR